MNQKVYKIDIAKGLGTSEYKRNVQQTRIAAIASIPYAILGGVIYIIFFHFNIYVGDVSFSALLVFLAIFLNTLMGIATFRYYSGITAMGEMVSAIQALSSRFACENKKNQKELSTLLIFYLRAIYSLFNNFDIKIYKKGVYLGNHPHSILVELSKCMHKHKINIDVWFAGNGPLYRMVLSRGIISRRLMLRIHKSLYITAVLIFVVGIIPFISDMIGKDINVFFGMFFTSGILWIFATLLIIVQHMSVPFSRAPGNVTFDNEFNTMEELILRAIPSSKK